MVVSTFARVRWTMLGVIVALVLGVAPAAAQILVSETTVRATSGSVSFRSSEGAVTVSCALTLTMTLTREIGLEERTVAGGVTEARVGERCTGGSIALLVIPSQVRLISFRGGVIKLQLDTIAFLLTNSTRTLRCLYRGSAQVTNAEDPIASLRSVESVTQALSVTLRESAACPRSTAIAGSFTTNEVGYTETVAAGRPLQPTAAILEFAETIQLKEMEFTNEWIIGIRTSNSGVGGNAPRFLPFTAATECFALERIPSGGRCTDKIRLIRAREAGEDVSVPYTITLLAVTVGLVTLER